MYLARSGSPGRRHASRVLAGLGADVDRHARDSLEFGARVPDVGDRTGARRDPRVLRRGPGRARLPRGRRAARARPLHRRSRGRPAARRSATSARTSCPRAAAAAPSRSVGGASRARMVDRRGERGRRASGPRRSDRLPPPREDRPGQPVYVLDEPPEPRRDRAARGDARTTSSCSSPPARTRTARSSGSTRSSATRRASAGARGRRSRRAARWLWRRGRHDPLQGGGLGLDAVGRPAPAGLGRPARARPRLRAARDARPLPPAARARAAGLPLRPPRERAGDRGLRGDRHAPHDLVPQPDLLRKSPDRGRDRQGERALPRHAVTCGVSALLRPACLVTRRRLALAPRCTSGRGEAEPGAHLLGQRPAVHRGGPDEHDRARALERRVPERRRGGRRRRRPGA